IELGGVSQNCQACHTDKLGKRRTYEILFERRTSHGGSTCLPIPFKNGLGPVFRISGKLNDSHTSGCKK
ncbi:MAG: hypothetical protein ACKVOY_17320, partial [Burkholderiaceae bacterium]